MAKKLFKNIIGIITFTVFCLNTVFWVALLNPVYLLKCLTKNKELKILVIALTINISITKAQKRGPQSETTRLDVVGS